MTTANQQPVSAPAIVPTIVPEETSAQIWVYLRETRKVPGPRIVAKVTFRHGKGGYIVEKLLMGNEQPRVTTWDNGKGVEIIINTENWPEGKVTNLTDSLQKYYGAEVFYPKPG